MKKVIVISLISLMVGCSSTADPRSRAANKQWNHAYDGVDHILSKNIKDDNEKMIELVDQYPQILEYGVQEFSIGKLRAWSGKVGDVEFQKYSVKRFCVIASEEQCATALKNIDMVDQSIRKNLSVNRELFVQLSQEQQDRLSEKYNLHFYEPNQIGIVTDRQIRNLSTPGSNFGAELGGAVGATAYVSKATPSSYSLKNDVGNTLLGAVVGAMLLNQQPVQRYQIRYTVKLRNGDLTQVDHIFGSPIGEGAGVCINTSNAQRLDQSFCTMTLSDFRLKFADDLKGKLM